MCINISLKIYNSNIKIGSSVFEHQNVTVIQERQNKIWNYDRFNNILVRQDIRHNIQELIINYY